MALSIRSSEVERLARELSRRTGLSITQTIRDALETRRNELDAGTAARLARIEEISQACAAVPDKDPRGFEEILGYDGEGTFRHGGR